MNKQTQDYIILKPIADRFNKVASEITDEDIKYIIKQSIKEQVDNLDFSSAIQYAFDEFLEDKLSTEYLDGMFRKMLENRLK